MKAGMQINTAGGKVGADALGRTLMHEHLLVGLPGWEADTRLPAPDFRNMVAACVERVQELQAVGYSTLVDPCPSDLGRNIDLFGEVAARTGFNIIFAAGLYNERFGGSAYWTRVLHTNTDPDKRLAEVFIREIEDGVMGTGLKAGILKVGTSLPPFTEYEQYVFRAAAIASQVTSVPITTHTDGVLGEEQLDFLIAEGVPAARVVIGHCCGNPEHTYHMNIVGKGAYAGFDRFGMEHIRADAERVASLIELRQARVLDRVVISHDSVCCWLGRFQPEGAPPATNEPLRFTRVIRPMLEAAGMTAGEIEGMLIDNPRRYFSA
jgi:phosphotriesterase-related protein